MSKVRVLVVDDSLTMRATIEQVLVKGDRCRVIGSAASVEEARQLIKELDPDVITLDLALPGADGFSLLDERMAVHHAPTIVISSSTVAGGDAHREAIARGAAACFDKAKLMAEGNKIVKEIQMAALQHLRRRVASMERGLKLAGTAC